MNKQEYKIETLFELIKEFREQQRFLESSVPFTSSKLISKITKKLKPRRTHRVGVWFTIEWALYLKYICGISNISVIVTRDCDTTKQCCNIFGFEYILYKTGDNVKPFDCIVGNPPYQDAKGNPLYYKFHNQATQLLKPNGLLAFVTPDAMAVGLETGIIKGCHAVEQREILLLNISTDIKKEYFKDVGINNFCYYVIKNTPKTTASYQIITASGTTNGVINTLKPLIHGPLIDSILQKCFQKDINYYNGSWNTAGKSAIKDVNSTANVVLNIDNQGNFVTYSVKWVKPHNYNGIPKVFITGFGNRAAVAYDHTLVCATEKNLYTVPTSSDKESEHLVNLLECSLQQFLTKVIKARGPRIDFVKHFKGVPLTKNWTDSELYTYFNLTQEEIDYISSIIR